MNLAVMYVAVFAKQKFPRQKDVNFEKRFPHYCGMNPRPGMFLRLVKWLPGLYAE
jgi:hypothetical protein